MSGDIDDVPAYSNYSYISDYEIRIRNNMPTHNLVITDLFDRLILNTTIFISAFTYAVLELPIYRLGVINLDDESHKLAIRPYLSGEEWQLTPEIAPGYFLEFWVCNRTYSYRIYSIGTTYYDNDGVLITLWDEYKDGSPRKVPTTIIIPFIMDEEEEEAAEAEETWKDVVLWSSVSALVLIIIIGSILLIKSRKKKGLNK